MNGKILGGDIISLLEDAVGESIQNFEVVVRDDSGAGKGYLGEMVFVSLSNKKTNKIFELVVKQQIPTKTEIDEEIMEKTFFNEMYFYQNIWKTLDKFQREYPKVEPFDKISKVYAYINEPGKRKLAMENLKHLGFDMFPRDCAYDEVQSKFLMESYGRFHATSAAFREKHPEEFKKLVGELKDSGESVMKLKLMRDYTLGCMRSFRDMIENEEIRAKLNIFCEDGIRISVEAAKYSGRNPVIIHGDCWTNNIMAKFDTNGIIADIKLIDFQICSCSSVVTDLAYLLYSSAAPNVINNLDHYLKIYHDSFSTVLRNFDLDPSKIFTFDDLKREWKQHCVDGFFFGQMFWFSKLERGSDGRNLVEINEAGAMTEIDPNLMKESHKADRLKEILVNLAQHVYDNGYI